MIMISSNTIFVSHEGPANALALNKDCTQVVIAGRNVFKVFSIENNEFREVCNLRVGKNLNLNYSSIDVAWSPLEENTLATAATNGAVVVWNLGRSGRSKQEHVFCDHKRTVNKVSFHLTEPSLLISGSQDGMMKCFDLRMKEVARTFLSNTESVRDVQFCRQQSNMFAAVSENGSVQLWDVRKADRSLHHYTAHSGPVFACDWHPDLPWLATASRDKTIKVWDIHSKPTLEHTIYTIASVGHIKWRPQRKYHIASCALVLDSSVCIWDIRRPHVPLATFDEHRDVTTAIAWIQSDLFLSTSRDCTLYRHTFDRARYPSLAANPQAVAVSPRGQLAMSGANVPHPSQRQVTKSPSLEAWFPVSASSSVVRWSHTSDPLLQCARNYRLKGGPLNQLCLHNAKVARDAGRYTVGHLWEVVEALYRGGGNGTSSGVGGSSATVEGTVYTADLPPSDPSPQLDSSGATDNRPDNYSYTVEDETESEEWSESNFQNSGVLGLPTYSIYIPPISKLTNGHDEEALWASAASAHYIESESADWTLPEEAFPLRAHAPSAGTLHAQSSIVSANCTASVSLLGGATSPGGCTPPAPATQQTVTTVEDQPVCELRVSSTSERNNSCVTAEGAILLSNTLKAHAAIGDVQTPVAVMMILGENRSDLFPYIEESLQEHWLLGYIELLARNKLWNLATEVIRGSWVCSVWQVSQQSTCVHVSCARCCRHLSHSYCDRCKLVPAVCAICNQVVKGLFTWCQGCAHGGHIQHMRQWLMNNKQCPTGCGHYCEYT